MFNLFGNDSNEGMDARARRQWAARMTGMARNYGANPTFTGNPHGEYAYMPRQQESMWQQLPQIFSKGNLAELGRSFTPPSFSSMENKPIPVQGTEAWKAAAQQRQAQQERARSADAARSARGTVSTPRASAPAWVNRVKY